MVTRRAPSVRSARQGFAWSNELAARIVLQDVAQYGGEGAGLVQWARLIEAKAAPKDAACGPLFAAGRAA
jgi:hypothetical protein